MANADLRLAALEVSGAPLLVVRAQRTRAAGAPPRVLVDYANNAVGDMLAAPDGRTWTKGSPTAMFSGPAHNGPNARVAGAVLEARAAAVTGVAIDPDGHEFKLEARVAPLAPPPGEPPAAVITLRALSVPASRPPETDLALAALDAAAEELAFAEATVSVIANAFPGVFVVVDEAGKVRMAGGDGLADLGLRPEDLERGTLEDGLPSAVNAALDPILADAREGARLRFEFSYLDRAYEGVATPLRVDHGRQVGVAVALHDVSDARQAYAVLSGLTRQPGMIPPGRWGL